MTWHYNVYSGRDYTDEEVVFLLAMDRYKRLRQRPFPTWREVLNVLLSLGYRRVAEPGELPDPPPGCQRRGNKI